MACGDDAEEPDVVRRTAPPRSRGEQRERETLGNQLLVDRVVVAPRAGQAEHVPVAQHLHLVGSYQRDAQRGKTRRVVHPLATRVDLLRPGPEPRRVGATRTELVATVHDEAIIGHKRGPDRTEHAGRDRTRVRVEHGLRRVVAGVDRGEAGRRRVGHRRPSGRTVGVRELLEHRERILDAGFRAAQLLRYQDPEQLGLGERVDHDFRGRRLGFGLRRVLLDQRPQRAGLVEKHRSVRAHAAQSRRPEGYADGGVVVLVEPESGPPKSMPGGPP